MILEKYFLDFSTYLYVKIVIKTNCSFSLKMIKYLNCALFLMDKLYLRM